jgi:hypothetical protein
MRPLLTTLTLSTYAILTAVSSAQTRPDPAAHKAAMQKLKFLEGTWTGDAFISFPAKQMTIRQTEVVQYKLDGVVMTIEGTGRNPEGKPVFQAFAVISFDQGTGSYRIRAWNDGNFIEEEIKVDENRFEWGFQRGPVNFSNHMKVDESGKWIEVSETTVDGRKVQSVQMSLTRSRS